MRCISVYDYVVGETKITYLYMLYVYPYASATLWNMLSNVAVNSLGDITQSRIFNELHVSFSWLTKWMFSGVEYLLLSTARSRVLFSLCVTGLKFLIFF